MKLKAKQTLVGHYGKVATGDEFEAKDSVGESLLQRGLAEKVTIGNIDSKGAFDNAEPQPEKATQQPVSKNKKAGPKGKVNGESSQ